ncbi:MAG: hypothetical protein OXH40_09545, partial [Chloroflexi bacterium]|nr:hypothetical protein [Chloroflexota bacterium]
MTTNAPLRTVIEGHNPSRFNSVTRARAMLNNGPNALNAIADDLRGALSDLSGVLIDRPSRLLYTPRRSRSFFSGLVARIGW